MNQIPDNAINSLLSNSVDSIAENRVATSKAVKIAYDKADAALPKSGGVVTGNIVNASVSRNDTNSETQILSSPTSENGGALFLYGKDNANSGNFLVRASNGTNQVDLVGQPDGTLRWGGQTVLVGGVGSLLNGVITRDDTNSETQILSSPTVEHGGALFVYGKDSPNGSGGFRLRASNGTSISDLVGQPNGIITWCGSILEIVSALGSNYIRYKSGIQICWGHTTSQLNTTFPVPFNSIPAIVANHNAGTTSQGIFGTVALNYVATTGFTPHAFSDTATQFVGTSITYIAIGTWS